MIFSERVIVLGYALFLLYTFYMDLKIKKLHQCAKIPTFAHATDAGIDFYALEALTVAPMTRAQVGTGIAVQIPDGYVGLVWDKSGLSHKKGSIYRSH